MRKIILFDTLKQSNLIPINIGAELARNNKKVLILDFRQKKVEYNIPNEFIEKHNIYHCLNENCQLTRHIVELEPKLWVLLNYEDINEIEFHLYYELLKRNYFDKKLKNIDDFDYVIFLVSPILSQLTFNILSYVNEAISLVKTDVKSIELQNKINRFLYVLKKFYGKEIFFSKIIPAFDKDIDKKSYNGLVNEMTQLLVTSPMPLDRKHKGFGSSIKAITLLIMSDEDKFDDKFNKYERQKSIDEYYNIETEKEKTLDMFNKTKNIIK